uniref:Protein kinase domain-containing protein n=1 Tax=Amphimedon queenslandica TaxID=400682 RepID=A0A1X7UNN9_AMPQE
MYFLYFVPPLVTYLIIMLTIRAYLVTHFVMVPVLESCNTNFFVNVSIGVGKLCLESCVGDTYLPDDHTSGECLPCFNGCSLGYGCAGPGKTFNDSNGCMSCDTIVLDKNGDQIECQRNVTCPSGYHREQLSEDRGIFLTGTVLCHSCHELCATCSGPSVSDCVLCSYIRGTNGSCVYQCDPMREIFESVQCVPATVDSTTSSSVSIEAVIGSILGRLILITLTVLVILILILFSFMKNRKSNNSAELEILPPGATKLTVIPETELEFKKELGSGTFGTVYEGYWKPDNDEAEYHVAIKILKSTSADASKELLQGMAYLESKSLVHRDLAARNILVQSHLKVLITDFGLTRFIKPDESHYEASGSKLPVRWLPPESIQQRIFTHKTDVWSFGVTVWEILTFGESPFKGKSVFELLKLLEKGDRLKQPKTCTLEFYKTLQNCWELEPEKRPSFEDLVYQFNTMMISPKKYVKIKKTRTLRGAVYSRSSHDGNNQERNFHKGRIEETSGYVDVDCLHEDSNNKDGYVDCLHEDSNDKDGYVDCLQEDSNDGYIDCFNEDSNDKDGYIDCLHEDSNDKDGYVDCLHEDSNDKDGYVDCLQEDSNDGYFDCFNEGPNGAVVMKVLATSIA